MGATVAARRSVIALRILLQSNLPITAALEGHCLHFVHRPQQLLALLLGGRVELHHPRVLRSLLCCEALHSVHGEQLSHQVLGFRADVVPDRVVVVVFARLDFLEQDGVILVVEGGVA